MAWLHTRRGAAVVLLAAFALLAFATPHGFGLGDAGEFVLALALTGVPHPTGYPLYVLFGSAWVRMLHTLGVDWAHAANLWSALGAALAAALTLRLAAAKLLRAEPAAALAGLGALAAALALLLAHPVWLAAAGYAEVQSWHLAWVAAMLWVSERAHEHLEAGEATHADALRLGVLAGAGLAHHLTSVWVTLPCALLLCTHAMRRGVLRPGGLVAFAAAALAPLASYAWIAYRAAHPAAFQWPLLAPGWEGVYAHASGRIYAHAFLGGEPAWATLARLGAPLTALVAAAGLVLAVAGARTTAARYAAAAALAAAVLQTAFVLAYGVPDGEAYLLPVLLLGLASLPAALRALPSRAGRVLALAALAVVSVREIPSGLAAAREARVLAARVDARIRHTWLAIPFERGIVLWADDHLTRLTAWQLLGGERAGLVLADPRMFTWPAGRAAFERRTGVDPVAGLTLRTDSDLASVPGLLQRRTGLPVLVFDEYARGLRPPSGE